MAFVRPTATIEARVHDGYAESIIATSGLVGYWRLGEQGYNRQVMALTPNSYWRMAVSSGNLVDSAGAVTGTANGSPSYGLAGPISDGETAIGFDGSTAYFTFGDVFDFTGTTASTISFWMYQTAIPATVYEQIVSKTFVDGSGNQGWSVLVFPLTDGAAGRLQFKRTLNGADDARNSSAVLPLNQWNHIVVTYDGTTMHMYINGVVQSTGTASSKSLVNGTAVFTVGAASGGGSKFTGRLARVFAISGRAISQAEVTALYAARTQTDATVSAQAADASGNALHGTYATGVILGATGALADGTAAATVGSATATAVSVADSALLEPTTITVEAWINPSATQTVQGRVFERVGNDGAGNLGYQLLFGTTAPYAVILIVFTSPGVSRSFTVNNAVAASTMAHVVATYDGQWSRIYVNGVSVGSNDFGSVLNIAHATASTTSYIGNGSGLNRPLACVEDEVALYARALSAAEVAEHYWLASTDGWLALENDALQQSGFRLKYGIDGNGPTDCVAATGQLQAVLNNSQYNDASTEGYYSPSHASVRSGWTFGIPIRAVFTYSAVDYTKFTGKIRDILPLAGKYRSRQVQVTAYDIIRDLAETDAREVAIQTNKAEDELLDALIAAMPTTAQPMATAFDTGVDTYPYVFDKVGGDTKVLSAARDIVVSSLGMLFSSGDGTLTYLSRHGLATMTSAVSLGDADLDDLGVPSSLDGAFNRVRVTTHPKTISAAATEELYTLPSGSTIELGPGAMIETWTAYTDPNDRQTNIGGTDVVTVLVGGTHYAANSQADGLGTSLTASITATLTPFASTAKWSLTNNSTSTAFITLQTVIGKAVRDPGPRTFESYEEEDYGDRPLNIDLPYQDDPYIGQSAADYIVAQYSSLSQQIQSVTFLANRSAALLVQALTREPGDLVTLSETITGVSSVPCIIQSVELEVRAGMIVICKWGLRPATSTQFWQWGVAGFSEWGLTTNYAF